MSLSLIALLPKHERRIRLVFSGPLALGAFGSSPAVVGLYTVANVDGRGLSPTVSAAIVIASNPNAVELALGVDLVEGALYTVSVAGVPAVDLSTATGSLPLRLSSTRTLPNQELASDDHAAELYGVDLVHDGTDYVEDVDGDLAEVRGVACAQGHLGGGVFANGLPWAPDYGAFLRHYVDATAGSLPGAKQAIERFFRTDDRVRSLSVTYTPGDTPADAFFDAAITLVGGDTLDPLTIRPQTD